MKFRFENLQVWQDARQFANHIYSLTKIFPHEERFGLTDQLRRAAVSIALNIAEGSDRKSDIEFKRYLRISITSTEEVVTALFIALDQKYLDQIKFDKLYEEAHMIVAKLNALINKLIDYHSGSPKSVDGRPLKGFTLIELLVVISIIAVLSTVGFTLYQGAQSKARDVVRKTDLNKLATALEIHYQSTGSYVPPASTATGDCSRDTEKFYGEIKEYMPNQTAPLDPKDNTKYCYIAYNNGQSYRLFANIENCSGTSSNTLCDSDDYNFTVYSPDLTLASVSAANPTPTPTPTSTSTPTPTPAPTPTPPPLFPASGLVAYYPMNESSADILDSGSSHINGTASSGVTVVSGKIDNGRSFNGTGFINLGSPSQFKFGTQGIGDFSWSIWVKTTSGETLSRIIADDKNLNNHRALSINNSTPLFTCRNSAGDELRVSTTTSIADGNWHHLAAVKQFRTGALYIDGVSKGSAAVNLNINCDGGAKTYIGARDTSPVTLFLNGVVDEVGIWNRALSKTEVSNIYNRGLVGLSN